MGFRVVGGWALLLDEQLSFPLAAQRSTMWFSSLCRVSRLVSAWGQANRCEHRGRRRPGLAMRRLPASLRLWLVALPTRNGAA